MRAILPAMLGVSLLVVSAGCPATVQEPPAENVLLIFHNGTGPMCIEALDWLVEMQAERPDLVVEQHLTTDLNSLLLLGQLKAEYGQSQGVSTTFGYLPLIFFRGQAFSGFNDDVKQSLAGLIRSMSVPSS